MAESTNEAQGAAAEDRLPWLEAVEEDDDDQGVAPAKLIGGVIAALAVVGLVVGGAMWVRDRNAMLPINGAPETIAAADAPYKVKPSEPGGMAVEGQGDTTYAASQGADPNAPIDLAAVPEAPVAGTKGAAAKPEAPPAPEPAKPTAPKTSQMDAAKPADKPAKPAAASGGLIQLGSFSSEAKANAAWTALSKRFAFLGGLDKSVVSATVNSATVYRLRAAAGGQANSICGKLKVAGETCMVVKS